ncbi:MAG: hypothetical protein AMJ81_00210 [Phycisphaerae bacterium SM23_33]|nr:MAG: hypothetical protein AMJ81_00210 [Phycisphaerae bacterium SM23_33]
MARLTYLYQYPDQALWLPLPGPQLQACLSEADILYFGGQAGGGKSDLLIGLALTSHKKSLLLRREFPQLRDVVLRTHEILADTNAKYNSVSGLWRDIPGDRILELASCQYEKDVIRFKGRPHDLVAFDEIADFTEHQFRFLTAWARTTILGQRVRVIACGNPPTAATGRWVIKFWAPWLDEKHPDPAVPGELRWFARVGDEDVEVESGEPFEHDGETIQPKSRTFIPARLSDNPYLANTGYEAILQGLPEPLRSQLLYGDFTIGVGDDPWQIIPTDWVRLAQERWKEREKPGEPMTCLGVDVARGGKDRMVMAPRWGNWFGELAKHPGKAVTDGPRAAALVVSAVGGDKSVPVNLDIVGWGSSPYDILRDQGFSVKGVNFGEGTKARDKSKRLEMRNVRAEAYWGMRESLDPHDGDDVALPDDPELLADLTAPKWKITTQGVQVESKEDIVKRLKRSPDCGDAVVLANLKRKGVFVG